MEFEKLPARERLGLWSRELFDELLPAQSEPGVPVLLACDDETVRIVADRIGSEAADPSAAFAGDVRVAFSVGKIAGWKLVAASQWQKASKPRPLPPFFSVLCLWVLAATRMAPDEKHATNEYHGRLCSLLGIDAEDALPFFEFIGPRFHDLASWLEEDLETRNGRLILPEKPTPKHVGYAVAQTVFRLRDRQVLSKFFAERLQGSLEGFDPLRRLQRWSGRGALTNRALSVVENEEFADRVRAAVQSAFHSWDGAELVETERGVGRFWPSKLRLIIYPEPHIQAGAGNQRSIELTLAGQQQALEPGREVELPWALVSDLLNRPIDLGDPRSPAGALRLPRLGQTALFEDGDDGLLLTESPAAETVWVLTRDVSLGERLGRWRFNDGRALPTSWKLYFDVPIAELPGVQRSIVAAPETRPLQIEGGLPLGHPRYLSGHPPRLVAGDLESDDALSVSVNGTAYGEIHSGERLELPALAGRFDLVVGDGYFHASYDVEDRGEPEALELFHQLGADRALRTGARPLSGTSVSGVVINGATVLPAYSGPMPLLTRVRCDVETIDVNGELVLHRRPPTPPWFQDVGLSEWGRWEIFADEAVWLIMPGVGGPPRARLVSDKEIAQLSSSAAERVSSLGFDVTFLKTSVEGGRPEARWKDLVRLAGEVLERSERVG